MKEAENAPAQAPPPPSTALEIIHAESHIRGALSRLPTSEEYLRDELYALLATMNTLLEKMTNEEVLRRDRCVMHREYSDG